MAETKTLEQRFHEHTLYLNQEIGKQSTAMGQPWRPTRMLQMLRHRRGLGAARVYLARPAPQPGAKFGLGRLAKLGLTELSLEVAELQHPWRALFTSDELATARRRLEVERAHLRKVGDNQLAERLEQVLLQLPR